MLKIKLPWNLNGDGLVDVILIQLHTPILFENGVCKKFESECLSKRASFVNCLAEWIAIPPVPCDKNRPLFVLMPELSFPLSCIDRLIATVKDCQRPIVAIAGLEYLDWSEYEQLISKSDLDEGDKGKFTVGGNALLKVNAAVIAIGNGSGDCSLYTQPKTFPYRSEHSHIYRVNEEIIFITENQTLGQRINFNVQICSDYTSPEKVEEFRRRLCDGSGLQLDMTILLQCNKDQNATAFRAAIKKYYDPISGCIETTTSTVVFVNNANEKCGKTTEWGRSKVKVRYRNRWNEPMRYPQPTYYAKNYGDYDHQELVFRESGPGIYLFRYKLGCFVSAVAGAGDEVPFADTRPTFAYLDPDDLFERSSFKPIFPFFYWLKCQWDEGCHKFENRLSDNGLSPELITICMTSYSESLKDWLCNLPPSNQTLYNWIELYFLNRLSEERFPFNPAEPTEWCAEVDAGVIVWLEVYALLRLSPTFAGLTFSDGMLVHAFDRLTIPLAFLYARGKSTYGLLFKYFAQLKKDGKRYLSSTKTLILVAPDDTPDKASIEKAFSPQSDVTIGHAHSGAHLNQGSVVTALSPNPFKIIYSNDVLSSIFGVVDESSLLENIHSHL